MSKQPIVLSGMRPTGKLHLGNLLGPIRTWIKLTNEQDDVGQAVYRCFFFVASLHGLTTEQDAARLRRHQIEVVRSYIAAGLDPGRVLLYAQQDVPELTELSWILNCISPLNQLGRMAHFLEKSGSEAEEDGKAEGEDQEPKGVILRGNAGLFTYPVLMAADIIGPQADFVPVGEDQLAHLEFAQLLARRFNRDFGELFTFPDAMREEALRILSLDGEGKMSKSAPNGAIFLDDTHEQVWEKLRVAKTDINRKRLTDPGDPEKCNIFALHQLVSPDDVQDEMAAGCRGASIGCIDCKQNLQTWLEVLLAPIRIRLMELQDQGDEPICEILAEGGRVAREHIRPTVERAKELVGLAPFGS